MGMQADTIAFIIPKNQQTLNTNFQPDMKKSKKIKEQQQRAG